MATAPSDIADGRNVTRWTRLHIFLHWMGAALIALQFVGGDWMAEMFDAKISGEPASGIANVVGLLHITIGITIFLAVAARLGDHFVNGRPPHPVGEPNWAQNLARVTQTLLYATVLAMPIAGLYAWFVGNVEVAGLHEIAGKVLLALIALHAAGALANQYWFKTDVLRKMLPGHGR